MIMRKGTGRRILVITLTILSVAIILGAIIMLASGFQKLSEKEEKINTGFSSIEINTSLSDVDLVLATDGACRVVLREQKNLEHTVEVKDGKLKINVNDTRKWYQHIGISFTSPKITVYLPKSEYAALSVNLDTGNVYVPKDFSFGNIGISGSTGNVTSYAAVKDTLNIKTGTGKITVKDSALGTLNVTASTGNVTLTNITCTSDVSVTLTTGKTTVTTLECRGFVSEGSTGDIVINGLSASGELSLERSTGKITASAITCAKEALVKVTTGKVHLTDMTCDSLTLEGTTGDLRLTGVISGGTLTIIRSTGDVIFEDSDGADITVETTTGSVKGTLLTDKVFTTETDTGNVDVPDTASGGACNITTETGNISIEISG